MEQAECEGWLKIFLSEGNMQVRIQLMHFHTHAAYEDISLPEKWKKYITDNLNLTPAKVSHYTLQLQLLIKFFN
jgi:hypothetical protein